MDYGFMVSAREVTNERYLKRLVDFVNKLPHFVIYNNRAKPDFLKHAIKRICRFGDNLTNGVTDETRKILKQELQSKSILEVAAKYNLTEHFVKNLKYAKT